MTFGVRCVSTLSISFALSRLGFTATIVAEVSHVELSTEELVAVENGQPVRCTIPGSKFRCVVIRDDVFDALRSPVSVVEEDLLSDIDQGLSHNSPADWKDPTEWGTPRFSGFGLFFHALGERGYGPISQIRQPCSRLSQNFTTHMLIQSLTMTTQTNSESLRA